MHLKISEKTSFAIRASTRHQVLKEPKDKNNSWPTNFYRRLKNGKNEQQFNNNGSSFARIIFRGHYLSRRRREEFFSRAGSEENTSMSFHGRLSYLITLWKLYLGECKSLMIVS